MESTGGPEYSELVLAAPDGVSLAGYAWTRTTTPLGVVLIVHGLKDHTRRYGQLVARLLDRGFAAYGFDLRGHAKSGGPRVWVRRFDQYLTDLDSVVQEIRRRHPGLPILAFGHSMGGTIATLYVITRDAPLRGLVLSAPALRPGGKVSRVTIGFTKFLSAIAPKAAVFQTKNSDFSRDPRVVEGMDRDPLIFQRPAPARTAAELLRAMQRIREGATRVHLPLLVLHGTADRLTSPEGSRELHRYAGAADKTLRLYTGLYHDLTHEPEKETVLNEIVDWLGRHLQESRGAHEDVRP